MHRVVLRASTLSWRRARPGARLDFIADAVIADAAYSQAVLAGAPGVVGAAPSEALGAPVSLPMALSAEDVAAATALGTPVMAPEDGVPAIGVPSLLQARAQTTGGSLSCHRLWA